jgi:hypothetical protein
VLAAHDAQAHKLEPRLFDDGFEDRLQMGCGGKDAKPLKLQSLLPAAVLMTATQPTLVVRDERVCTLPAA